MCGDIVGVWIEPVTAQVMPPLLNVARNFPRPFLVPRSNFKSTALPDVARSGTAGKAALLAFDRSLIL